MDRVRKILDVGVFIPRKDWFQKRFYVYGLCLPPRFYPGCLFYIGKGQGSRMLSHEARAMQGDTDEKSVLIRQAWAKGHDVIHEMFFQTDDEDEAYAYEANLITKARGARYVKITNIAGYAKDAVKIKESQLDTLWRCLGEAYPEATNEERQALVDGIVARDLLKEVFEE